MNIIGKKIFYVIFLFSFAIFSFSYDFYYFENKVDEFNDFNENIKVYKFDEVKNFRFFLNMFRKKLALKKYDDAEIYINLLNSLKYKISFKIKILEDRRDKALYYLNIISNNMASSYKILKKYNKLEYFGLKFKKIKEDIKYYRYEKAYKSSLTLYSELTSFIEKHN